MLMPNDPLHQVWADTAAALGFGLFLPLAAFDARATFKTLKRGIGTKAGRPSVWAWMYGRRTAGETLVIGQSRGDEGQLLTTVVARIDPPLFLGVEAYRQPNGLFEGRSWAPERTAQVFARAPTALTALAAIANAGAIGILDSTVVVNLPGIVADAGTIGYVVETARNAASALSEARKGLPKSEGERAQEATWGAFADTEHLKFDANRLEISGTMAGAKVRIALEGEPFAAVTTVNVELPGNLGLGLSVTKQRGPSILNSLVGIADLPSGDPWFDEAYVVRGNPAPTVQQMIFNPLLRRTIDDLARAARSFELGDAHLFAQYTTPLATEPELRGLRERIAGLVAILFPSTTGTRGPYR